MAAQPALAEARTSGYLSPEQRHGRDLSEAFVRRSWYNSYRQARARLALIASQERLWSHRILERQDASC
jgi:hypothetical protein